MVHHNIIAFCRKKVLAIAFCRKKINGRICRMLLTWLYPCLLIPAQRSEKHDLLKRDRRKAGSLIASVQEWPVSPARVGLPFCEERVLVCRADASAQGWCSHVCWGPCWLQTLFNPLLSFVLTTTLQPFAKEMSLQEAIGHSVVSSSSRNPP